MKTSEAIRIAVDKYLYDGNSPCDDMSTRYLCWCIVKAAGVLQVYESLDTLQEQLPLNLRLLSHEMHKEVVDLWKLPEEERQPLRFMYAEFLALYYEDLGD